MNPSPDQAIQGLGPSPASRKLWRAGVSLALFLHFSAVIIAAISVSPSSQSVRLAWWAFRPYLQTFYLNHGYNFFAPEPAESNLVAFVAERPDGSTVRGRFPNREIWPRLLYHRYFMLTEHMAQAPPELQDLWYRSYAEHLLHRYGATKVSLSRQIHYLPTIDMVRDGIRLDDPRGYTEQPLGVFQWNP